MIFTIVSLETGGRLAETTSEEAAVVLAAVLTRYFGKLQIERRRA